MRKTQTNTNAQKKAMIQALEKSLGVISTACKTTGVPRSQHYKWYKEDSDYRDACDDVENITLDFVESKLYKQIEKENITAIIFHLKTKGKKRGYIEKVESDITITENQTEKELLEEIESLQLKLGIKNRNIN